MASLRAVYRSAVPVSPELLYRWHAQRGAMRRLMPPWVEGRVMLEPDELADGTQAALEIKPGLRRHRWVAEHFDVHPGEGFSDRQLLGPFASWSHHHRFLTHEGGNASLLEDELEYRLPFGLAGRWAAGRAVGRQLDRLFVYRHAIVAGDSERYAGPSRRGRILISGHSGLIGGRLWDLLETLGYEVRGLTRSPQRAGEFGWQPQSGEIDRRALDGVDAVVHLAGANVAGGRWTERRRRLILESREQSTRLLAETMARMEKPPRVLVSVSGANAYELDGHPKTERSERGSSFLAEVSRVWEESAEAARRAGIRVVHPRIGVVLSPEGGALSKMLPAFRAGAGGPLGTGEQMFSWIGMDDLLDVFVRALEDDSLEGVINAVSPEAVTQRQFAETLGHVLHRPARLKMPEMLLQKALGAMADETLLANLNVRPERLEVAAFRWRHPGLEGALRHLLGRPTAEAIDAIRAEGL